MGCIVGEKMEIKLIGETETELICVSPEFRNDYLSMTGNRYEIEGYSYAPMFEKLLEEINEKENEDEYGDFEERYFIRNADDKIGLIEATIEECFYLNSKYHRLNSCGQISMPKLDDITLAEDISKEDYQFIVTVWGKYHFMLIKDIPKVVIDRLCKIFNITL